jgi:hypothetical protein
LIERLSALSGLLAENFTLGPSRHFLDMGRRLERAVALCETLRALAAQIDTPEALGVLLDLSDSQITYRSRYLGPHARRCSTCCCSTRTIRARWRSRPNGWSAISSALPALGEDNLPEAPLLEARAVLAPLPACRRVGFRAPRRCRGPVAGPVGHDLHPLFPPIRKGRQPGQGQLARVIYDIRHTTCVDYAAPVRLARFNLRLRPAPWPTQTVRDFRLTVDPLPWTMEEEAGPFLVNRNRLFIREPIDRWKWKARSAWTCARPPDGPRPDPQLAQIGARRRPSRPIRAWPGQLHLSLVDDRAFARDRRLGRPQPAPGRRTQRDGCRAGADACHPRRIHL